MVGLFGSATVLCGIVIANDLGIVDHLFDFHLDVDGIKEQAARDMTDRKENERRYGERSKDAGVSGWSRWSNDNRSADSSERGTYGPPDRDN